MRWSCIRCRISTVERPWMASQVLQVSRLQKNTWLHNRLRRTGSWRLLWVTIHFHLFFIISNGLRSNNNCFCFVNGIQVKLATAKIGAHTVTDSPVVPVSYKLTDWGKLSFTLILHTPLNVYVLISFIFFVLFSWNGIVKIKFPHRNHSIIPIQPRLKLQLDKDVHDAVALYSKPRNNWLKVNIYYIPNCDSVNLLFHLFRERLILLSFQFYFGFFDKIRFGLASIVLQLCRMSSSTWLNISMRRSRPWNSLPCLLR